MSKRTIVLTTGKQKRPVNPAPVVILPPKDPLPVHVASTIESAAMDNWQEATVILCFAIIGVMYLVMNRSSKEEEKEASLAAKHLVPKPK
jgi:hypothetical protein